MDVTDYKTANLIHPNERDLVLHDATWPRLPDVPGWSLEPAWDSSLRTVVSRTIDAFSDTKHPPRGTENVEETILRFPSAPIYSISREFEFQLSLPQVNFHSVRALRSAALRSSDAGVERVYLLINGLNEVDRQGFYYKLAALLAVSDPNAVVLLRPLPGHLSRFPLPGDYAENPLDRYLADSGNLFRQFLRYTIESQWLLSMLAPHRSYRSATGCDLVAEGDETNEGRTNAELLAKEIFREWKSLYAANDPGRGGIEITEQDVRHTIEDVREMCRWTAAPEVSTPPENGVLKAPALHVIGYSLGGFAAQSLFFAWPFAVSSCTTICSGGALRDVAPSAFAHPEDWANVLYSLRYEIEDAMLSSRLKIQDGRIAGIDKDFFGYLLHLFYEVFLQDFRGEYASRVAEYVERILFVVGGEDPIVRVENVQRASPPGGINMIEIASLGHFIGAEKGEWRDFWLPAVSNVLSDFARRTESIHARSIYGNWWPRYLEGPPVEPSDGDQNT